jgi:hypothetical protein
MGTARPPPGAQDPYPPPSHHRYDEYTDVQVLLEENAQLRQLVIRLSKLVIMNVVDRK